MALEAAYSMICNSTFSYVMTLTLDSTLDTVAVIPSLSFPFPPLRIEYDI